MDNFIYEYYIRPIVEHTGYNIVNTLTYAALAIGAVYGLLKVLKGRIKIDERFIGAVLCFVLFGSTMRVVTDAIDTGVFAPITPFHAFVLDSHLWDYSYLTVTPGIYILTAAIMFIALAVLYMIKRVEWLGYVGLALWLPHFLLLLPFMTYAMYAIPILILAAIPAYLAYRYFKDPILAAIVAGQALDGAATFFVIDIFSKISGIDYFEQHVFSAGIGDVTGT
ncbi:MAG: DUF63 family protein, partial [Candidatus ainarchaeum sp.]|nr:DUF63 family protein [Candidatus ainarchaeum sp.]